MSATEALSGKILARIAILQSMAAMLPNRKSVLAFVCRGLMDVAGVNLVKHHILGDTAPPPNSRDNQSDQMIVIPIKHGNTLYADLHFYLRDCNAFEPYKPFISNFANMLAVIFEEETQRNLNKMLIAGLEQRVTEGTQELRASKEKYQEIVEKTSDLITSVNRDGICTFVNSMAEKIFGLAAYQCLGKSMFDFLHPEDHELTVGWFYKCQRGHVEEASFENRQVNQITKEVTHLLWTCNFQYDSEGEVVAMHSIAHNITARKNAEDEHFKYEQQLQQTQKLESLGLLAGGIAHDFNNLMGGIFGYIDMASEASTENKVTSYLSKAMNTIDRARALTLQLLTFAKGGAPIQKIDHLFPFIEETARFALSGANVSCHFDVPQDLWACNFDKNQIGQVIDNLIINAQQAMPVGGTIELTARNITLADKEHPLLSKGNFVRISVKDSGIGIPKELIAKIFDPFFTTKAKGRGLGLATCYSIIKRHGGCIDVESAPGKGSTFQICLPASMDAASSDNQQAAKTHTGSGIFLIMDDEEVMRDSIGDMLETLGYTVVSKENGKDAIEFFASETKANRKITGIIFDLTVPGGMGGKAAIQEIRKTTKEIPAFVASGYADDPVMKKPTEYGFMASICKPFRKSELSEILNTFMKPNK